MRKKIGEKVPLVSYRQQCHWRLTRCINSQHSVCFSSGHLDIVKYYRPRTFINGHDRVHGVNYIFSQRETGIYFL